MSILKRVPNNIRQLRDFLNHEKELKNKYYYYVKDFETNPNYYFSKNETIIDDTTGLLMLNNPDDPQRVIEETELGELKPLGNFTKAMRDPEHSYKFIFRNSYTNEGISISAKLLKDVGIHHLVYTDYPPAAGSVPLTYENDYIESMRLNDLDGGRKKTRHRKNRKSKKTQKYKKRRGKQ